MFTLTGLKIIDAFSTFYLVYPINLIHTSARNRCTLFCRVLRLGHFYRSYKVHYTSSTPKFAHYFSMNHIKTSENAIFEINVMGEIEVKLLEKVP